MLGQNGQDNVKYVFGKFIHTHTHTHIYIYMCVCVCTYIWESEPILGLLSIRHAANMGN